MNFSPSGGFGQQAAPLYNSPKAVAPLATNTKPVASFSRHGNANEVKAPEKEYGESKVRLTGASFGKSVGSSPLPDQDPDLIVLERAYAHEEIRMAPGRYAVEMCPLPDAVAVSDSGLYMVARDRGLYQPDAGVVISASPWASRDPFTGALTPEVSPLWPGQAVIVNHEAGHRLDNAVFGWYEAATEVRVYGSAVSNRGYVKPWPRAKSIFMVESPEGLLVVGGKSFLPDSEWVLLCRDGVVEKSDGGVFLPDSAKYGGLKGTVIDAGYRAWGPDTDQEGRPILLQRGQRVLYTANVVKAVHGLFAQGGWADRLVLVHVGAIHGVLNEETPEDELNGMIAASRKIAV